MDRKVKSVHFMKKGILLVTLFFLTGCIRMKMTTLVMPNGSGKLTLTIGINEAQIEQQMKEMFGGSGSQSHVGKTETKVEPEKLQQSLKGFVAFTKPREVKQDGWLYVTSSAYFEDINKIQFLGTAANPSAPSPLPLFTFAYTFNGASGNLVIQNPAMAAIEKGSPIPEVSPNKMNILQALIPDDFEWRQEYIVPGEIVEAKGISTVQNRQATFMIGKKELMTIVSGKKVTPFPAEIRLSFQGNQVSPQQAAAFKQEIAKAKKEWAVWQKELRKKGK